MTYDWFINSHTVQLRDNRLGLNALALAGEQVDNLASELDGGRLFLTV